MATRVVQTFARKTSSTLSAAAMKRICLSRKFEHPFTFEGEGPNIFGRITTHATPPSASRQVSQTNASEASSIANKSAYATVAPGIKSIPSTFQPAAKFRVPFDEGPSTRDPVVRVDSIAG